VKFNPNSIEGQNILTTVDLNTGIVKWTVEGGDDDGKLINQVTYTKLKSGTWYFTLLLDDATSQGLAKVELLLPENLIS
jgi:hypothetical protein